MDLLHLHSENVSAQARGEPVRTGMQLRRNVFPDTFPTEGGIRVVSALGRFGFWGGSFRPW